MFVLNNYGEDDCVFREFCAGIASHRWLSGDIAAHYDQEADEARAFLTHPCRWIREWASDAERTARRNADWFRADDEEIESP